MNNLNYYRILGIYYLPVRKNRESEPVQGVFSKYSKNRCLANAARSDSCSYRKQEVTVGGDRSAIVSHIQDGEQQAPRFNK